MPGCCRLIAGIFWLAEFINVSGTTMFAPSLLPENNPRLLALHAEMVAFYNNSTYHNE